MSQSATQPPAPASVEAIPFWRDARIIGILAQIVFVVLFLWSLVWLFGNVSGNLERLGPAQFVCRSGSAEQYSLRCAFDFLSSEAAFAIAETPIPYTTSDSYWRAIGVGVLNTAKVSVLGIVMATVIGTAAGIARLSENWLIRNIAGWYVDIMRNTPLLLQLFFIYFVILLLELPPIQNALRPLGLPIFISQRGINYPKLIPMSSFGTWLAFVVLGLIQAQLLWFWLGRREIETGKASNRLVWTLAALLVVAGLGWWVSGRTAHNEGFMVSRAARVREVRDLVAFTERRLGIDNLTFVDEALADGRVSAERYAEATVKLCTVADSPSEFNLTTELRRLKVPYSVQRFDRPDQVTEAYAAEDGVCELFVAPLSTLAAERDLLEDGGRHLIVTVPETPVRLAVPRLEGFNYVGGGKMTLEFTGLLLGLTLYTGGFIAEVVRGGILSVSRGQTEAARALGLSEGQRLRLIVLPQALRVIIPPLTSQYLNLSKNSSLALAIGYPDLWQVMSTIINQAGRSIQPVLLTAGTYLAFSLVISFFLNWYNRRIQLVER